MKNGLMLLFLFSLVVQVSTVKAQIHEKKIDLEQGAKYLVSIKVDHPEDVKSHIIQIGTTRVSSNEGLKYNPVTGCLETVITIPQSTKDNFRSLFQHVIVQVMDSADNDDRWANINGDVPQTAVDLDPPQWISGQVTKLDERTLRIDVVIEEEFDLEGRLVFTGIQSMDGEVMPLGMTCIPHPRRRNKKYCTITVTLPPVIPIKQAPFGYLHFIDEAGNFLRAKISSETEPSTSSLPRLYLEWPFLDQRKKSGKLEPIEVTDVSVTEYNTQAKWILARFKVKGNYEYLGAEALLNDNELKSFLKCGKKDAHGVALCTLKVILPKVTKQSEFKFQFNVMSDQGGSFGSLIYSSKELGVFRRIIHDTKAPEVLDVTFQKLD